MFDFYIADPMFVKLPVFVVGLSQSQVVVNNCCCCWKFVVVLRRMAGEHGGQVVVGHHALLRHVGSHPVILGFLERFLFLGIHQHLPVLPTLLLLAALGFVCESLEDLDQLRL